jgi:hypothetical protein
VTVAVKFCVLLTLIVADVGETLTPTAAVTVVAAVEVFVVSATEVAFSVTAAGLGTLVGALYVTEVIVAFVRVPQVAPLHPVPESDHVTPLLPVSLVRLAVKFCLPIPACTLEDVGESVIEIAGAVVTVTVAESVFVVSTCEIAVTVTAPLGTVAGAMYKPAALIVPTVLFPPVVPFTCQVTAVFDVFVTAAVKCCVRPT